MLFLQGLDHFQSCLATLALLLLVGFHGVIVTSEECSKDESKYSKESNEQVELSDEEMFKRGHLKPLGSHKPPDFYADVLKYMISPEDFYMNYVVAHKPVVIKGEQLFWLLLMVRICLLQLNCLPKKLYNLPEKCPLDSNSY